MTEELTDVNTLIATPIAAMKEVGAKLDALPVLQQELADAKARIRKLAIERDAAEAKLARETRQHAFARLDLHEAREKLGEMERWKAAAKNSNARLKYFVDSDPLGKQNDKLWAENRYLLGVNQQAVEELAQARRTITAYEAKMVRVAELRSVVGERIRGRELNTVSSDRGYVEALRRLVLDFPDVFGTESDESADGEAVVEPASVEAPVVTKEMAIEHMRKGGVAQWVDVAGCRVQRRLRSGQGIGDVYERRYEFGGAWRPWTSAPAVEMEEADGFYTPLPILPIPSEENPSGLPQNESSQLLPPDPTRALNRVMTAELPSACVDRMIKRIDRRKHGQAIGVKLLREGARMPERVHEGDAGLDVFACLDKPVDLYPGHTTKIPLGFALDIPAGYYLDVRARSGNDLRGEFTVRIGLVDAGYRNELCAIVRAVSGAATFANGDKIAQMVIGKVHDLPLVKVEELSEAERGLAGFGSTDTKVSP